MKTIALISASAVALTLLTGCPLIRPIAKTVADVAHELCIQHYQESKPEMSPEDIARGLCATEEALRPFIEAILSAKQQLAKQQLAQKSAAAPAVSCPVAPSAVAPVASAAAPVASAASPAVSAKPAPSAKK